MKPASSRPSKVRLVTAVAGMLCLSLVGCQRGQAEVSRTQDPPRAQSPGQTSPAKPVAKTPGAKAQAGGPTIDFDSRVHDFGTVNEGDRLKHVFTVKNTGTSPLVLSNVSTSCGCTAASRAKDEIPPGESGPIEVTFDTHMFRGSGTKTVMVDSNDPKNPTSTLEIKYNIERLLGFEQAFVRLETKHGTAFAQKVWLDGKLVGQAKPQVTEVDDCGKQVQAKAITVREDGKTKKGLEIKLKANKPISEHGNIRIKTGLADPAELVLRYHCNVE